MTDHEHLGDLLSALLDGELSSSAETDARAHLAGCLPCAHELTVVARARRLVRALPPVDPPFGFYERLLRGPTAWRRAAAALAASAAAAVAVVTLASPKPAPTRPPVDSLVQTHAASASASGDPVSQLVPAGVPVSFQP